MKELRLHMQHLDLYAAKVYVGAITLVMMAKYICLNYICVTFGFIYVMWIDEMRSVIGLLASVITLLVVIYSNRTVLPNALKWLIKKLKLKK